MERPVVLPAVLGVHLVVAVAHGITHGMVPVWLPPWQSGVVTLTTFIGPVVGVALARRGHPWGVPVFTVAMAGALLVGGALHFGVENPDHVAAIPAGTWRLPFQASAAAVGLTTALGSVVGAWDWWRSPR